MNVYTATSHCFSSNKPTYSNVPPVIKFPKLFERPNLKLLGLHFIWKCATFTWADTGKRESWKQRNSTTHIEEPGFQLWWSQLPRDNGTGRTTSGSQIQGASGTILISMVMQLSECINSLCQELITIIYI